MFRFIIASLTLSGSVVMLGCKKQSEPNRLSVSKHTTKDKELLASVPAVTATTIGGDITLNEGVNGKKTAAEVTFKKGNKHYVRYFHVDGEGTELEGCCGHKHGHEHHHLEADGAKQKAVRSSVWRIDLSKRAEQMPEGAIIHIPPSNDFDSAHVKLIATTEAPAPWGLVD